MTTESAGTGYDLKSVKMPTLTGISLRLFVELLEGPLGGLLMPSLLRSGGILWLREQQIDEAPTPQPLHRTGELHSEPRTIPVDAWPATSGEGLGFHFASVHDYAEAYRDGKVTPLDVAHSLLEAVEESDAAVPPLRAVIALEREGVLRQAEAATARLRAGRALSVFDGVPVGVKDEVAMCDYPTTVGTSFLGQAACDEDATVVARLRAAGALLIGKTNMHEIGIGVTGLNPHHGTPRNPYGLGHFTGGSSSGSAAAVAAGLCPVAVGADGGGSIRIPASFCGVVGLKPTFGRVSEYGAAPLCWSVAHLGPLAATATDAALAYAAMAGPDPRDPTSWHQPAPTLHSGATDVAWDRLDLKDLTLGVYWAWFRHATSDVVSACEASLAAYEGMGASIREVTIPDLEAGRIAHTITIASEMAQALSASYAEHCRDHGLDVRLNLALARAFTSRDYVQAQRVRARLMAHFDRALAEVNAIMTPATALVAPPIRPQALSGGESDLSTLVEIMRFATPANLTGLPAISFPVGYNSSGLPIGLQAIGRAWDEPTLLRLALAAEQWVHRRRPERHYAFLQLQGVQSPRIIT
jgi:Asp-tRNA(Asn)/Glu-tRNA(Gln) amidotransferase A subunit family amidase